MSKTTIKKLQAALPKLSVTDARIANYVIRNIDNIVFETGSSLARRLSVSEISVSRFLRKIGYKGIAGLKLELQLESVNERHLTDETPNSDWQDVYSVVRENEVRAIDRLFQEFSSDGWRELVRTVAVAEQVFVTGFQAFKGTAEDFARRLTLARDNVRFLSANDNMLGEWLSYVGDRRPKLYTLVLIDGIPYAGEGLRIAEIAKELGVKVVVISDETCEWAPAVADHMLFAPSRSGLFIESTVALVLALNILVDSVARINPMNSKLRLDRWQILMQRLTIF